MPSSTDTGPHAWLEAARDTRHLVSFRAGTSRRPGAAVAGVLVVLALTVGFAVGPASLDASGDLGDILDTLVDSLTGNVGVALLGTLLLSITSAMSSGGGRELLSRSEAAIHPVSARTEHLGALVLAPLNLAWLIQVWGLMAVVALVTPPERLLGAQVVVVTWILAATAGGQAVGWVVGRPSTRGDRAPVRCRAPTRRATTAPPARTASTPWGTRRTPSTTQPTA